MIFLFHHHHHHRSHHQCCFIINKFLLLILLIISSFLILIINGLDEEKSLTTIKNSKKKENKSPFPVSLSSIPSKYKIKFKMYPEKDKDKDKDKGKPKFKYVVVDDDDEYVDLEQNKIKKTKKPTPPPDRPYFAEPDKSETFDNVKIVPIIPLDPIKDSAIKFLKTKILKQPQIIYTTKKKVKHHHYHPTVFYKKKKIPGKYWHEAQRRLVVKHGGLDILGDIPQLRNGKVVTSGFGQNIPNFNDGFLKPNELQQRLLEMQRQLIMSLIKRLVRLIQEGPPPHGLFLVKEINILE